MTPPSPREIADALTEEQLDERYGDDPRLTMLVAWRAIRAQHQVDPARLLARMDAVVEHARASAPTGPGQGGELREIADALAPIAGDLLDMHTISRDTLVLADHSEALNRLRHRLHALTAPSAPGEAAETEDEGDMLDVAWSLLSHVDPDTEGWRRARDEWGERYAAAEPPRRTAPSPAPAEPEGPRLPATTHEADEQVWAVHDELRKWEQVAKGDQWSAGPGVLMSATTLGDLADRLTTGRWRPTSPAPAETDSDTAGGDDPRVDVLAEALAGLPWEAVSPAHRDLRRSDARNALARLDAARLAPSPPPGRPAATGGDQR